MRALEVFIEVADQGSLAGAARTLLVSPPTVTRVVDGLEKEVGVLLLHRTTRAISLTEPGRGFLTSARQIVQDYRDARDAARGAQLSPRGVLRLTAPVLFGQHYVSPILLQLLDEHPEIRIDAVYLDRVVNLVDEGFDVAVRIGHLPDSSLSATRVCEVRQVVCGSREYFARHGRPETLLELSEHQVVAARPVTPTDRWRFSSSTVNVSPRLSYSSVSAAIAAATAGWGLTRVLSYQIGPEVADHRLETVLCGEEPEALPVHLVHAGGRDASAKVRAFMTFAAARLRDEPRLRPGHGSRQIPSKHDPS